MADHKDITKLTVMLTSAISSTKAVTAQCLELFNDFDFLWKGDREEAIQVISVVIYAYNHLDLNFFCQREANSVKVTLIAKIILLSVRI